MHIENSYLNQKINGKLVELSKDIILAVINLRG